MLPSDLKLNFNMNCSFLSYHIIEPVQNYVQAKLQIRGPRKTIQRHVGPQQQDPQPVRRQPPQRRDVGAAVAGHEGRLAGAVAGVQVRLLLLALAPLQASGENP